MLPHIPFFDKLFSTDFTQESKECIEFQLDITPFHGYPNPLNPQNKTNQSKESEKNCIAYLLFNKTIACHLAQGPIKNCVSRLSLGIVMRSQIWKLIANTFFKILTPCFL